MTLRVRVVAAGEHHDLVEREGVLDVFRGVARLVTPGGEHLVTFAVLSQRRSGEVLVIESAHSAWRFLVLGEGA